MGTSEIESLTALVERLAARVEELEGAGRGAAVRVVSPVPAPRTTDRRHLLKLAGAGLAGAAGAAVLGAAPAAAAGDPVVLGATNAATAPTVVDVSVGGASNVDGLRGVGHAGGAGLDGLGDPVAGGGIGVRGTGGPGSGTGVAATGGPPGVSLSGGFGVQATGGDGGGIGIQAVGGEPNTARDGGTALVAIGGPGNGTDATRPLGVGGRGILAQGGEAGTADHAGTTTTGGVGVFGIGGDAGTVTVGTSDPGVGVVGLGGGAPDGPDRAGGAGVEGRGNGGGVGVRALGGSADRFGGTGLVAVGGSVASEDHPGGAGADITGGVGHGAGADGPGLRLTGGGATGAPLHLTPRPTAGPPLAGGHTKGDLWLDNAATLWLCTADGVPGSWTRLLRADAATGATTLLARPIRLLDTRSTRTPYATGTTHPLQITGAPDLNGSPSTIPAGAIGVVGNVTVVNTAAPGYLTLFPAQLTTGPTTSTINYVTGQVVANACTVALSAAGALKIFAFATTDVVFDATGYLI